MNHTNMKYTRILALLAICITLYPYRLLTMVKVKTPLTVKFLNLLDASMSKATTTSRYAAKQIGSSARQRIRQVTQVAQKGVQNTITFWNSKLYKEFIEPIYIGNELDPNYLPHKKRQIEQIIESYRSFKQQIQSYLHMHPEAQNAMDYYETALESFNQMFENLSLNPTDPEYQEQMQLIQQHLQNALQILGQVFSTSEFQAFIKTHPETQSLLTNVTAKPNEEIQDRRSTATTTDAVAPKVFSRTLTTEPLSENSIDQIMQHTAQQRQMLARETQQQHGLLDKPLIAER